MTNKEMQEKFEELLKQLSSEQVKMLCEWWEKKSLEVDKKELDNK